jgi:hypothetical protein
VKILKAKLKNTSIHYKKGLNRSGKSLWLKITGFSAKGNHNFKLKVIRDIVGGFAEYEEIWVNCDEVTLKQFDDDQLSLDIFSLQEQKENMHNPRYFNQRRYEVQTPNDTLYFYAPNEETVKKTMKQYGICDFKIKQIKRLTKKELDE